MWCFMLSAVMLWTGPAAGVTFSPAASGRKGDKQQDTPLLTQTPSIGMLPAGWLDDCSG